MTPANNTGGPAPRTPRLPALAVLLTVMLAFFANAARADCLESPYPDVRSLEALGVQDPKKALEAITTALAAAQKSAPADKGHVAALYAVAAQSYSLLELDADARAAASTGLQLAPESTDLTHLALQIAHAENIALPLGNRDDPARVKKVENMRRLDALIIGWQHHHMARAIVSAGEECAARGFGILEMLEQGLDIRGFEIIA